MPKPLVVALPPNLSLKGGSTIRVTAIDPANGSRVATANVANVMIEVEVTSGSEADLATPPFMLVPGPRA